MNFFYFFKNDHFDLNFKFQSDSEEDDEEISDPSKIIVGSFFKMFFFFLFLFPVVLKAKLIKAKRRWAEATVTIGKFQSIELFNFFKNFCFVGSLIEQFTQYKSEVESIKIKNGFLFIEFCCFFFR